MRTLTLSLGGEYLRVVADGGAMRLWRWTNLDKWQPASFSEWTLSWVPSERPGADVVEVHWHGVPRPSSVVWGLMERGLLRRIGDPAARRDEVELVDVDGPLDPYTERALRRRGMRAATNSQRVEGADGAYSKEDE